MKNDTNAPDAGSGVGSTGDLAERIRDLPVNPAIEILNEDGRAGYKLGHEHARQRAALLVGKRRLDCRWSQDEDGNWKTSCGEMFIFLEDGPKENEFHFCCYCGGALTESKNSPLAA